MDGNIAALGQPLPLVTFRIWDEGLGRHSGPGTPGQAPHASLSLDFLCKITSPVFSQKMQRHLPPPALGFSESPSSLSTAAHLLKPLPRPTGAPIHSLLHTGSQLRLPEELPN